MTPIRVLLHAPTAGALIRARRNAKNLSNTRPDAEILVIANADAVASALTTADVTDPLLRICRNSLTAQGLKNTGELVEVEAAVATLAELQTEGWVYIRA